MAKGTIVDHAPILLVKDVVRSAEYWRDKVGLSYSRFWGEPPAFCMPQQDGHIIMLSQAPKNHVIVPHWKIVDKM